MNAMLHSGDKFTVRWQKKAGEDTPDKKGAVRFSPLNRAR
jgi:hypothetical protein